LPVWFPFTCVEESVEVVGKDGVRGFAAALAAEHAGAEAVGEREEPGGGGRGVNAWIDLAFLLRRTQVPGEEAFQRVRIGGAASRGEVRLGEDEGGMSRRGPWETGG